MASRAPQRRKGPRADDPQLKGRRSNIRSRVMLAASADAISGHVSITVLEVSLAGARLSGSRLPAAGKDVMLNCAGVEIFGTVVWSKNGQCGVQFDESLSPADFVTIRKLAAASEQSGLTPDERQAIADWMNGVAR